MANKIESSAFYNDLFVKNQYVVVSNRELKDSTLDRLPDEIIVHILSQPILNISTLGSIIEICPRLKHLALQVLSQYRLPSLQMALQIDQEGKNRITSKFQFEKFDPATLTISMICINKRPRRYYASRASPLIRTMNMIDTYNIQLSDTDTIVDDDYSSYKSKEENFTTQIIKAEGDTINGGKVNRKITTKKEGLHILQVIHNASQAKNSVTWKLVYQITQKQGQEYHLLPISIIITLDQLPLFNKKRDKKRNKMVDWVINYL